ncbi:hypothetical protein [Caballeronia glebae]|nr:hypothetical protein [Caballeronia glebae]
MVKAEMFEPESLKKIAGRIDSVTSTEVLLGSHSSPHTRYVIHCGRCRFAFYVLDRAWSGYGAQGLNQTNLRLRVGDEIEVVIDAGLVDREGDKVAYGLRHLETGTVYASHAIMGLLPPRVRMTTVSCVDFKDDRRLCRIAMTIIPVLWLVADFWHRAPLGETLFIFGTFATFFVALESFFFLYLLRWRSKWPSRAQSVANKVYSMLGAGPPFDAGSNVAFV